MRGYWCRLAACGRDIQLFLIYGLLSYLGIGAFSLIFNLYLVRLGYDEGFIGAFNGVMTLSMGITCLAIGFLINRFGNWTCIVWGTAEFTVTSLLLCLVTNGPALLLIVALNGIGSAFILTTQMPFVIEWTPEKHRSDVAAMSSALNSASVMLGSLLGGVLPGLLAAATTMDRDGVPVFRWTLIAATALTALAVVPMLLMSAPRLARHHEDFHIAHAQLLSHRVRRQARRDVIAVFLVGLTLALGIGTLEPFYNVLLEDSGMTASRIGVVFALSGLAATLLSLSSPWIAARIGYLAAQLWMRLMHVPIHLALIPFPSAALIALAYGSRRTSGSMAWPLESAHVGGLLPPRARAHAFGLRSASWNMGYALAAFVAGQVIAATGSYRPSYIAVALFSTLSVVIFAVAFGGRTEPAHGAASRADTVAAPADPAGATPV
jgi:MFS family permease